MKVAALEYRDGRAEGGAVRAGHAYLLKKAADELVLTPAPFVAAEQVTVDLTRVPGWEKTAQAVVEKQDAEGKVLGTDAVKVTAGKLELAADGKAFRYRISKK